MNGVERIAAERQRQVEKEDYDAAHDDGHENGELALAAATYALPLEVRRRHVWMQPLWKLLYPGDWFFKGAVYTQATELPTDTRIHELVKAGALIAAEIDRLDRRRRTDLRRLHAAGTRRRAGCRSGGAGSRVLAW